jgi:hypothetical protein
MTDIPELTDAERVSSINDMSARVIRGEAVSDEELAAAIQNLRSTRSVAAKSSPTVKKKVKAKAIPLDLNDLFGSGI